MPAWPIQRALESMFAICQAGSERDQSARAVQQRMHCTLCPLLQYNLTILVHSNIPPPSKKAATNVWPSDQSLHSASATADKAASYLHANFAQAHEEGDSHKSTVAPTGPSTGAATGPSNTSHCCAAVIRSGLCCFRYLRCWILA